MRTARGFTLIELMIVVVIVGILAAIAIPNFAAMQLRAREGSTKSNMHTLQLMAEDYSVQNHGVYAADAATLAPMLPDNFDNPFDHTQGSGNAWETRAGLSAPPAPKLGLTSYADSLGQRYNVKGCGASGAFTLVLTSGQ